MPTWTNKTRESTTFSNTQKTEYPQYIAFQDGSIIQFQDESFMIYDNSTTPTYSNKQKV